MTPDGDQRTSKPLHRRENKMTNISDEALRSKMITTIVIVTVIIAIGITTLVLFSQGARGLAAYGLGLGAILVVFFYFAR